MMDLLDRLLAHDAWTTRQLLARCRDLPDNELDHEFDFAHRTLRATFLHVIWNMEAWSDQIAGLPIRKKLADDPHGRSLVGLFERLDAAETDLGRAARGVRDRGGYDERWVDKDADPPLGRTYGSTILHVITHGMHHRAQILLMMKNLGVANLPEGDVLSWEQAAGPH